MPLLGSTSSISPAARGAAPPPSTSSGAGPIGVAVTAHAPAGPEMRKLVRPGGSSTFHISAIPVSLSRLARASSSPAALRRLSASKPSPLAVIFQS